MFLLTFLSKTTVTFGFRVRLQAFWRSVHLSSCRVLCVVYSVTLQSHFNDLQQFHFETRHSILCCQVLSQLHIYAIKLGYLSNCYSLHLFDFLGASSANRKFLLMQLKMFRTVLTLLKKCIGQLNVQLKLTQVRKNSYLKTKLNNIKIG